MGYLISQIIVCLIVSSLLGVSLGWLLRGISGQRSVDDHTLHELEDLRYDNRQLRARVSTLTAAANDIGNINRYRDNDNNLGDEAATLRQQLHNVQAELEQIRSSRNGGHANHSGAASMAASGLAAISQGDAEKDAYPIDELDDLSEEHGKLLGSLGIVDTLDLLDAGRNLDDRARLSEQTGVDLFTIERWVNMADLIRIPGIRGRLAHLLEEAGCSSVQSLARETATGLSEKLETLNNSKHIAPVTPSEERVEEWIKTALQLKPKIER